MILSKTTEGTDIISGVILTKGDNKLSSSDWDKIRHFKDVRDKIFSEVYVIRSEEKKKKPIKK